MKTKMLLMALAVSLALMFAGCPPPAEEPVNDFEVIDDTQQVDVELGEWFIDLNPDIVSTGRVQFNITNTGEVPHAFRIEDENIESPTLSPGEEDVMMADLSAGVYDVYCPIGDHAEQGMTATLTVTEE